MAAMTITAANLRTGANAKFDSGTAGAAITRGQPVYKDAAAGKVLKLADANASQATAQCVGIAMQDAASGQIVQYVYEDDDFTPGGTVVVGETYLVGATTAGDIAPVADAATGWYITHLGIGKSATKMRLKIHISDTSHV
jgi:hypothetical protein